MIKSTRHHLKDLNFSKGEIYHEFLQEYSDYVIRVVDTIWRDGYKDFSIEKNSLSLPKFIDYKDFDFAGNLSARARSSAVTQASEIIRAAVEKQRRRNWVRENRDPDVKNVKFAKPQLTFVAARLSSKCCGFQFSSENFLGFIELKSIGKKYGKIRIPITKHPRSCGALRGGFLFTKNWVQACWDIPTTPVPKGEGILAIDQGLRDVATCSDGQVSPKRCPHGHSLSSITDKLARKKKGSAAFQRAAAHRKNFVNWSVNQLNFAGLKEVRLEKIANIRYKRGSSRKMSHWSNPEIRDKIKSRCAELEVPVVEQACAYRSQRCSQCGQVRRANRKGKIYSCKNCGYSADADFNAALNHLGDLPSVPKALLGKKLNLGDGFFWSEEGFFADADRRVPCSQN